jgi:hypothetical protein
MMRLRALRVFAGASNWWVWQKTAKTAETAQ